MRGYDREMPFVKLPNGDATLFYKVNSGNEDSDHLDANKQTILFLHPILGDSESFYKQWRDPRLNRRFNLLAFDTRSHGKTRATVDVRYDQFVAAADVALALEHLQVPQKVHCVAAGVLATSIAQGLAILFPERFLSFVFSPIATTAERPSVKKCMDEISEYSFSPQTAEDFMHGVSGVVDIGYGTLDGFLTTEEEDEIGGKTMSRYLPRDATHFWCTFKPYHNRTPIPASSLASITHPVVIFHGSKDVIYTLAECEEMRSALTGSKWVRVEQMNGPHHCFFGAPDEFNTMLLRFYSTHFPGDASPRPETTFEMPEPPPPLPERGAPPAATPLDLAMCLRRADAIRPDRVGRMSEEEMASVTLETIRPMDFSCVDPEREASMEAELVGVRQLEKEKADLIPMDSWWDDFQDHTPKGWRFTMRHDGHAFLRAVVNGR